MNPPAAQLHVNVYDDVTFVSLHYLDKHNDNLATGGHKVSYKNIPQTGAWYRASAQGVEVGTHPLSHRHKATVETLVRIKDIQVTQSHDSLSHMLMSLRPNSSQPPWRNLHIHH